MQRFAGLIVSADSSTNTGWSREVDDILGTHRHRGTSFLNIAFLRTLQPLRRTGGGTDLAVKVVVLGHEVAARRCR
jgi:hypothetical protein